MKIFCLTGFLHKETKKWRRIMRLTLFLMFAFLLGANANSYSQNTRLNINLKNGTVIELMKFVEKNSEFVFLYKNEDLNLNKKVTIELENATIQQVLNAGFNGQNVEWDIYDRQIVLHKAVKLKLPVETLQQQAVTGVVTDQTGQPLPGVTVLVKGTTTGTVTNANGNFTLALPAGAQILQFSFVGMHTQEIGIDGRTTFTVVMEEETIGIEEVVAIGYGTMKKSDITGSISSVPMDLLRNQPIRSLSDIMQGRVAGMTMTKTSGQPNASSKIRIRGPNSISGSNEPLYVVDGIIGGNVGSVHDVESIEVLKDASATAIYGERASNGVILITTKRATSAKPQIRLSLNSGINFQNTDYPDKMNAAEYAEYVNIQRGAGTFSASEIEEFRKTGGTDWTDLVMQTGMTNDHNISYSQKFHNLGVYLSGRYLDEKGTMVNSNVGGNYQIRSNIDFTPHKRLNFNFDLKAHKSESWNGNLSTGGDKSHPLIQSLLWSPTEKVWTDEESGQYNRTDKYGALAENPYMHAKEQQYLSMSNGVYTSLVGNYEITDWLTYNVTGYAAKTNSQSSNYSNKWLNPNDPQASRSYSEGFTWRLINRIDLKKTFLDSHNFLLTGVYEAEAYEGWGLSGTGRNMPLPELAKYYKINLSNIQSASSSFGESSRLAYLGRLNYNFKSRYYLTASYRIDAQSGPTDRKEENKYGAFPSFAASWRISEESFMENGFFDDLKLRIGWGLTGNPSGFPYTSMSGANYQFGIGSSVLGYVPGTPANPNIKWEKTTQSNIGLDFTILERKLSVSLDYFNKKTTDLLTKKVLPGYFGYGSGASYNQNLGQINNNGYEAVINYKPIQTSDFYWGLNFNISRVVNEVIDLGEQEAFLTGTSGNGMLDVSTYRIQEGYPLGTMWGYKFLGIWGTSEAAEAEKYGAKPGDPKWEDVNKDYSITLTDDGQKIGDANPDFVWGLSSAFSYKNFDFDITFQGMHGQDVFNLMRGVMATAHPDARTIMLKDPAFNYWTEGNQNTVWPNILSTSDKKKLNSTQWIEKGSWVKVKYVGLTYHIPKQLIRFADLSVSLSGTELFTFTKYKGFDPEVSASGNSDEWGGCDFGTFPIPKSVNLGVILNF